MVKANHALSNSAQGVKFSRQVSRRKIYDVNLVHTSLLRKYQRLFYGEKSIIVQCTLKVVLKSSNISRRHLYDVIIYSMTGYVVKNSTKISWQKPTF